VAVAGTRAGVAFEGTDLVAVEVPVALEFNGVSHAVMLATPDDLQDFALGFSLTEGIVDSVNQVYGCEVDASPQGVVLRLDSASSCFLRLKDRRRSMAGRTGCGLCGTDNLAHAVRPAPLVKSGRHYSAAAVARGMDSIRAAQRLNGWTGATHAAAWCDASGALQLLREDVGRHNALDKLVGAMVHAKRSPDDGFVVVTSRASYEMVHKTAVLGAGLLAAVSGVTALAVRTADAAGLTLLGFVRGTNLSAYSHPENLDLDGNHE
jgi:FdhD protein